MCLTESLSDYERDIDFKDSSLESELMPLVRIWRAESELTAAKGQVESVKKIIDESVDLRFGQLD
jgi:hypothetical protein